MIVPTWLYHKKHEPQIFTTLESAELALNVGWSTTPYPEEVSDEKELVQEAQCPIVKKPDAEADEQKADKAEASLNDDIKKDDFIKMKKADLVKALLKKGFAEEDIKKLNKDELIAKLGTSK